MEEYLAAYGWTEWPFRVVVDERFAAVWADRAELKKDLTRRLRRLRALPHSALQLMWADFGAGKSHTLRHFEHMCRNESGGTLVPIYTEVPVRVDGLESLYQRFAAALDPDYLRGLAKEAGTLPRPHGRESSAARDFLQALQLLRSGDGPSANLAIDWLAGRRGTPHLTELHRYGIANRIDSEDRVVDVLAELVTTQRHCSPGTAIVWLVDEYQRISGVPQRKRDALARGMVSLFNACTSGLHMVLSFSVAQQSSVSALIPPDLASRAATFPMIALPLVELEDGILFLQDLFNAFRIKPAERSFPFSKAALEYWVEYVRDRAANHLTPRRLMEDTGALLFELYDLADGKPELPIGTRDLVASLNQVQLP